MISLEYPIDFTYPQQLTKYLVEVTSAFWRLWPRVLLMIDYLCLPANAGTAQRNVKMRHELYRNGPSLMPRSLGMTIQASTATTTLPTIQKVAKRLNIIPLLLGGWNSPKYVQTTGILPPTLQKPRLSLFFCIMKDKANLAKIAFRWTVQWLQRNEFWTHVDDNS